MTYQTPAPRYSRPIPASNLPPIAAEAPVQFPRRGSAGRLALKLLAIAAALAVVFVLSGCGPRDTRSNAERSYDACVERGMEPTSCAIGSEQVYRLPPRKVS